MRTNATQSPLFAQALQLFKNGAYPQAIALLQKAVAAQPLQLAPRLELTKACLDWVQIQAQTPLSEIEPGALSSEATHYLHLAQSQVQALAKSHPASPYVQRLLAMVHLVYGRCDETFRCLKKVLAKEPHDPDALYNMGYSLMKLERYAEAVTYFTRLTAIHLRHGMGWQMLGQAQLQSADPEAALLAFRQAMSLLPDWYQPYGGLASALRDLGRYAEARDALRKGLDGHPNNWDMNFTLANLSLSTGDWATGWRYYACRSSLTPRLPFPEGYVIPLRPAQSVKIRYDQGLGDELFFLRFVPGLAAQGMSIHYAAHPKLFPLLQGRADIAELSAAESGQSGEHDVLVGDLPYLAGMQSTGDIPPPLVLPLDAVKADSLRGQLTAFGPPPYLGVTWTGGSPKKPGSKGVWRVLHKGIPPALLGKLVREWLGTVVVLQRLPRPEDIASFSKALARPFLDWSHLNDDLSEALAGLSLLDEYVGVSNTNMHLLAGIGKTARVLVPHPADWRWMAEGNESPWFPGFGIYRQSIDHSWDEALGRLGRDLRSQYEQLERQQ
jgi:tetratricopeptide (TPR) repeat protein